MGNKARKLVSLVLVVGLFFQQADLAQAAGALSLAGYLNLSGSSALSQDRFRPVQMRYFSYEPASDNFKILLDKGDLNKLEDKKAKEEAQTLLNYFLVGVALPDDAFWVNLRPDSQDQIIDPLLEKTDVGRIMLAADIQLKKDISSLTSPQTPEGRKYWDKLYQKAGELYGHSPAQIPTITRPWIVPGEIIVRESQNSAYVYKAGLKVMLEEDYLSRGGFEPAPTHQPYAFPDPRLKELNQYSTQLIKELIIPKLTKEINSSKRYANLRQVYYSLIVSRWFKLRFSGKSGTYSALINTRNLTNLISQNPWDKSEYFNQYQQSFAKGEYNLKKQVYTPTGQIARSYVSGGLNWASSAINTQNGVILKGDVSNTMGMLEINGSANNYLNIDLQPTVAGSPVLVYPYSAFSIPLLSDAAAITGIENHMLLVQAGKKYRGGKAVVERYAALTNRMWTDLLRDKDEVGLKLHQEKLSLTAKYTEALKTGDFKTVREKLQRYVEIRDELCKRWLSLAIDAKNKKSNLPSYAYEYAKKVFDTDEDDYKLVKDLYEIHKDDLRDKSLYTWGIEELIKEAKEKDIALFPLGAGGPGANIIAVSEKDVEQITDFLKTKGIYEITDAAAKKIILGTGSLEGYMPFKVGAEGIKIEGFNFAKIGLKLPEWPNDGVFDQATGRVRELGKGETIDPANPNLVKGKLFMTSIDERTGKHINFEQGKPLDTSWIEYRIKKSGVNPKEVIEKIKGKVLKITAPLRGVDGCGSSQDLPEFQIGLIKEDAKKLQEFPSTPTIASDFKVVITFTLDEQNINGITYDAPDYGIKNYSVEEVILNEPDSSGARKLKNGQKDAPAYVFKNIFGLKGIKITCEGISPMALAGGMESSNAFNVALIAAVSILSGANLSYADIFNLAVKLENDEFNGLTGGQGHLSSILGGAYQHIWLSGVRDVSSPLSRLALAKEEVKKAKAELLLEAKEYIHFLATTKLESDVEASNGFSKEDKDKVIPVILLLGSPSPVAFRQAALDWIKYKKEKYFDNDIHFIASTGRGRGYKNFIVMTIKFLEQWDETNGTQLTNRFIGLCGNAEIENVKTKSMQELEEEYYSFVGNTKRKKNNNAYVEIAENLDGQYITNEFKVINLKGLSNKLTEAKAIKYIMQIFIEEELKNDPNKDKDKLIEDFKQSVKLEELSNNTYDNIYESLKILKEIYNSGDEKPLKIQLVAASFHRLRALLATISICKMRDERNEFFKNKKVKGWYDPNNKKIDPGRFYKDALAENYKGWEIFANDSENAQLDKMDEDTFYQYLEQSIGNTVGEIEKIRESHQLGVFREVSPKIKTALLEAGEWNRDRADNLRKKLLEYFSIRKQTNSSPMQSLPDKKTGGIDFRGLPMTIQPMGNFQGLDFGMPRLSRAEIERIDVESQIGQIKSMVSSGISPSGRRVKELVAACAQKGQINAYADDLLACIGDILKLEEETARESSVELKEALVLADLGGNYFQL